MFRKCLAFSVALLSLALGCQAKIVHIDILDDGRATGAFVEFSLEEGQGRAGKDVWIGGNPASEQVFVGESWQVHQDAQGAWKVSLTVSTETIVATTAIGKTLAGHTSKNFEISIGDDPAGDSTIKLIGARNCIAVHVFPAQQQTSSPVPGFEKVQGADALTYGSTLPKAQDSQQAIDPKHPRPRLRQASVIPGLFQDDPIGSSNIGVGSWDAKWSNYGVYLQKLIEAVQLRWDDILEEARTYPTPGTRVTVKFRLDSKGRVAQVVDVGGTSTEQGKSNCVSAITSRAPYGDWTDDMIAAFGSSTELTFVFFYQ